jgi:Bacterial extracellular solute-binding protein
MVPQSSTRLRITTIALDKIRGPSQNRRLVTVASRVSLSGGNYGVLYAVPIQMNAFSLFLNNRLFKEAGLDPQKDAPKSWEDVGRLSKKRAVDRVVLDNVDPQQSLDQAAAEYTRAIANK